MQVEVSPHVSMPKWRGSVFLHDEIGYFLLQLGQQPRREHLKVGGPCNGGFREKGLNTLRFVTAQKSDLFGESRS